MERRESACHLRHQSGKFRELHIIADHDTNLTTIGIEGLDMATATQSPALLLICCNMNLSLHVYATISTAESLHYRGIVLEIRHTTRDDIDVVTDGQLAETVTDFWYTAIFGMLCASPKSLNLAHQGALKYSGKRIKSLL